MSDDARNSTGRCAKGSGRLTGHDEATAEGLALEGEAHEEKRRLWKRYTEVKHRGGAFRPRRQKNI